MALDADPTSPGFNCYVSYADAETMASEELHFENWAGASETVRSQSLIMATKMLDAYMDWKGSVASDTQPLGWPRKEVQRADREAGTYFDATEVPDIVKYATVRYANDLIGENLVSDKETGLSALSVASIRLRFSKVDRKAPVPELIRTMLMHYGTMRTSAGTARVVRR